MTGWTLYGHWFVKVTVNEGCECVLMNGLFFRHWKFTHKYGLRQRGIRLWGRRGWRSGVGGISWWASVDGNISTNRFYTSRSPDICIYWEIQQTRFWKLTSPWQPSKKNVTIVKDYDKLSQTYQLDSITKYFLAKRSRNSTRTWESTTMVNQMFVDSK